MNWTSQRVYFSGTGLGLPLCSEHIPQALELDELAEVRPMSGEAPCAYCRHPEAGSDDWRTYTDRMAKVLR